MPVDPSRLTRAFAESFTRHRTGLTHGLPGGLGGPPAMLAGLIGEQLGARVVPIHYTSEDGHKRVEVPGIMDFEIEAVRHPETGAVQEITNTVHPMGSDLAIARSVRGHFD